MPLDLIQLSGRLSVDMQLELKTEQLHAAFCQLVQCIRYNTFPIQELLMFYVALLAHSVIYSLAEAMLKIANAQEQSIATICRHWPEGQILLAKVF